MSTWIGRNIESLTRAIWPRWGGTGTGSRIRFLAPGTSIDWEREAGRLWSNSVAAICLRWLGDNAHKPRLRVNRVARNGDWIPTYRHPLLDLWARPNPYYTTRTLIKAIVLSLKVDGNAYVLKVRSKNLREVRELWWVAHWQCAPCWPADRSTYISHYEIDIDGDTRLVPVEDIIHIRDGIDPDQERYGLSALKAQVREVVTDSEASTFTASLLKNAGVPSVAIVPGEGNDEIDPKASKAIKDRFVDATGGDSRGAPVVFARGAKIVELGFSPERLRLDRLPRMAAAKIAAALGTNLMTVGLPDEAKTYANQAEARRGAWENGLVPTIDLIGEALQHSLMPEFSDPKQYIIDFDYSQVESLREAQNAKSARMVAEFQGGLVTRNEAREMLGYDVDPEGDVYADGREMTGGDA
jgi:HK97 family phage portal protein